MAQSVSVAFGSVSSGTSKVRAPSYLLIFIVTITEVRSLSLVQEVVSFIQLLLER